MYHGSLPRSRCLSCASGTVDPAPSAGPMLARSAWRANPDHLFPTNTLIAQQRPRRRRIGRFGVGVTYVDSRHAGVRTLSPVDPKPAPRGRCRVGFRSHNRHRGSPFEEIIRIKAANAEATRRRVIRVSLPHAGRSLSGSTMTAPP